MIADISFLERRIEKKYNATQKKLRAQKRTPFYVFLALAIMVTGTLGGYLSLSHATTAVRRAPLYFQGRITDANYVPLADTSTRRMVFRIYNAATAGTCLWSTGNAADTAEATNCAIAITTVGDNAAEDNASVATTITRGVFSVPLGDTAYHANMRSLRLDFNNTADEVYYLEISVKNASSPAEYETLSPRVRVGATSYAYNADELDGINSTSFLRIDGTATQTAATSGTPTAISFAGATHTGLALAEVVDVNYNLARTVTFTTAGDSIAAQRAFVIQAPTYAAASATQTIGTAATMAIAGAPQEGSNMAFSSRTALWLQGTGMTWGALLHANYPSTVSMASTNTDPNWVMGTNVNLSSLSLTGSTTDGTGITNVTGQLVDGSLITLPAVTVSTAGAEAHLYGLRITGGALNTTGTGVLNEWYGARIQMPNITQAAGTTRSTGIYINGGTVTSGTSYALLTDQSAGNIGLGTTTPSSFLTVTQAAVAGGQTAFTLTPGNHTAVSGAEGITDFNSVGHTDTITGVITTQRFNVFGQSIFDASSAQTVTNAATVAIAGPPRTTNSALITTSISLRIQSGDVPLTSNVANAYGLFVDAPSGTPSGVSYGAVFQTGNVGIGTITPQSALQVSSGYIQFPYVSSAPAAADCDAAAEGGRVVVYDNGGGAAQLYVCDGAAGWVTK